MEYLQLYDKKHQREIIKMSNKRSKIKQSTKITEKPKKVIEVSVGAILAIVMPVAVTIIIAIISAAISITKNFSDTDNRILNLEKDNQNIHSTISELSTRISEMDSNIDNIIKDINKLKEESSKTNNDITEINNNITEIKEKLNITPIRTTPDITISIAGISKEENNIVHSSFTPITVIGTDSNDNQYIAEDLINKTILLTYMSENKEVYFLGQYDENYNWDGYCITNVYYLDGSLFGFCESNLENGKRLDYKSLYLDEEDNKWMYTNKICTDEGNKGISINYDLNYKKIKNFTNSNVRITDILYIDEFIETIKPTINYYYKGYSSDGRFNDNTGEAYYISYLSDGTIKTLYKGNFVKGLFNDDTGNAWQIKLDNNRYFYYKGNFKNNNHVGEVTDDDYVTQEEINDIIKDMTFDCELNWHTTNN